MTSKLRLFLAAILCLLLAGLIGLGRFGRPGRPGRLGSRPTAGPPLADAAMAHDDCRACHDAVYRQWEASRHARRLLEMGLEPALFLRGDHAGFRLIREKGERALGSLREALAAILRAGQEGLTLQRYKGLGEMNAGQLWETTMAPGSRTLLKVCLEDSVRADEMFTILMGSNVEDRRNFIERHALEVRDLDI